MSKTPLLAIIISFIALIAIYLFVDIKPNKNISNNIEVEANSDLPSLIKAVNNSLSDEQKDQVNKFMAQAEKDNSVEAANSVINFYENIEHFNIAAYYHSLKAQQTGLASDWELAGDRQLSVSQNNAFDAGFNEVLYQKAIESFKKALELDAENLDLKVKLGSAIVDKSEQPMEGISLLLSVIEADSMHANANLALGKFGIISQQYDKAILRLEKVLSLQPENTEALFLAAEAYSNLGENKKAITCLEKCKNLVQNEELKKEIEAYMQQLL